MAMRILSLLPGLLLIVGCGNGTSSSDGGADGGSPRTLVLLHTNDEHSHLLGFGPEVDDYPPPTAAGTGAITGGLGRRAVLLAAERAKAMTGGAASLVVSGGDNTVGTLSEVSYQTNAEDLRSLKQLGYDVDTLGNHEFDQGPDALAAAITFAMSKNELVQLVASNIHFSGTAGDAKLQALFDESGTDMTKPIHRSLLVTASNGLKVGFIGILGADAAFSATSKSPVAFSLGASKMDSALAENLAAIYTDLQPVVDHLRNDLKADLVIALSHSGIDTANDAVGEDNQIAANVTGIDMIVSAHTHALYPGKMVAGGGGRTTMIQQAGQFGQYVGKITATVGADHKVTFDTANTTILTVDDKIVADAKFNGNLDEVIKDLESTKLAGGKSFLENTLSNILGMSIADDANTIGDLYFYPIGKTSFDLNALVPHKEDALLVLHADALLKYGNDNLGATDAAFTLGGEGVVRASIFKGKTGNITFGDVFRVLPLGRSPIDGTLGFSIAYAAIPLAAIRGAAELTASLSYANDNASNRFVVPAGMQFEYDTSRTPYDFTNDAPTSPTVGRVTKISYSSTHTEVYDKVLWDTNAAAPGVQPPYNALSMFNVVADLQLILFAKGFGIPLFKTTAGNDPIAGLQDIIVLRADNTEVKDWEVLAGFLKAQSASGDLPSQYNAAVGTFPRRDICTGPLCVK